MDYFEIIKAISEVIIAVFTVALVWATYVLAKHTKMMDAHAREQQKTEHIQKCISLAESIIRLDPKELGNWAAGDLTGRSVHPFNDLLTLSKYIHDSDTKRYLEYVSSELVVALTGSSGPVIANRTFIEYLDKLRIRRHRAVLS